MGLGWNLYRSVSGNMQDRTCQLFKEVVLDQPGQKVQFTMAGQLGGVSSDLGAYKDYVARSPTVELTTTTLGDILERAHAPEYIHYMSLDIEGAELKALQGLPLDKYTFGALNIEHNGEEPKRSDILALLTRHGYTRTHTWFQDDYYVQSRAMLELWIESFDDACLAQSAPASRLSCGVRIRRDALDAESRR